MTRRVLAAVVATSLCAAASGGDAPRASVDDSVTWTENGARKTRVGVTVESAGFDQVVMSQGGRRSTVDGADVIEIRFGDAPRDFDDATSALRSGDGDSAAAAFSSALAARATSRGWLVEYCFAGLAESLLSLVNRDAKNAEKSARAFDAAREANPKSLLLDRILRGLAKADLALGLPDAALAAADDLLATAKTAKRPLWEIDAHLARADALVVKGDAAGALRAVEAAGARADSAAAAAKDADLAQRLSRAAVHAAARRTALLVAQAEATRSAESVDRARTAAEETLSKAPESSEAQASSTNAAGALLLLAGDARKALRKFVETDVLHFDVPDEAARALWYQSLCHERLGDGAARVDALKRLVAAHPASEWAGRDDVKAVTAPR
jgi:tetratricopeptide (TPR) repeat protein